MISHTEVKKMQSIVDIKLKELKKWFNIRDNVIVAYSGGVDSSLLAQIAYLTLGSKAIAITSDSPSIADTASVNPLWDFIFGGYLT